MTQARNGRGINGHVLECGSALPLLSASSNLLARSHLTHCLTMLTCSMPFELESDYAPRGDQSQAIAKLLKSLEASNRHQTLLGVTGSGKTFTMVNVVRELNRPTLVISHNKTLAAQLYSEFKQFFPCLLYTSPSPRDS